MDFEGILLIIAVIFIILVLAFSVYLEYNTFYKVVDFNNNEYIVRGISLSTKYKSVTLENKTIYIKSWERIK